MNRIQRARAIPIDPHRQPRLIAHKYKGETYQVDSRISRQAFTRRMRVREQTGWTIEQCCTLLCQHKGPDQSSKVWETNKFSGKLSPDQVAVMASGQVRKV